MISRGQNFKQFPINIVGSSVFGRYPKISNERTYNMLISDNFLVPYPGFVTAISNIFPGGVGRGIHVSTISNLIYAVFGDTFYSINIQFNQSTDQTFDAQVIPLGTLNTSVGTVYISENNKPQIAISDGASIYTFTPSTSTFAKSSINFTPGYIDFHDTYFLAASSNDGNSSGASNAWRLSASNDGTSWPSGGSSAGSTGSLQTKPDDVQAVVRFPSKGNMVLVIGNTVCEGWFDVGGQLFPYQRSTQFSIDYGCLNPATIARMDELVVWLAQNEQSGPIIVYTMGGMPEKITTDGIDYLMSSMTNPSDSQGFLFRQDGHLIYHINFYTDNISIFYDFNTKKFFHACDENLNYFRISNLVFFNNQYYGISKDNSNLYAVDTIFTTYNGAQIPRMRTCANVRLPTQQYFVANDIGFTIETGETPYINNDGGNNLITTQNGFDILTQDNNNILISNNDEVIYTTPRVDLSVSYDGGATFSRDFPYVLNSIGQRKNRLSWWRLGAGNDIVTQFKFWGLGRVVCTDGFINLRM